MEGVGVVILFWFYYNEVSVDYVWLEWVEKDVSLSDGVREFYG